MKWKLEEKFKPLAPLHYLSKNGRAVSFDLGYEEKIHFLIEINI